eukprot:TRINITY_DN7952_c0_g1_i1.p1 TRINITY_DN7952_c0_g1~~TRINITY_DN7952_c0_g1_i1.p1  ORF type:complete len:846 (+),score=183.48 TRINITY_DN7952_c0_g1_i1:1254-3791(+)
MNIKAGASSLVRVCAFLPTSAADLSFKSDTLYLRDKESSKDKAYPGIKVVSPAYHYGFCSHFAQQIITQASKGYNCCFFNYGPDAKSKGQTLADKNGLVIRVMRQLVKVGHGVRATLLSVGPDNKIHDVFAAPGTCRKLNTDDKKNYCIDSRETRSITSEEDMLDAVGIIDEAYHARDAGDVQKAPVIIFWLEAIIQVNNDAGTIVSIQFVDLPSPDETATTASVKKYISTFRKKGADTPTPTAVTRLIKQPFATGGNTIWLAAHLGTQRTDYVRNVTCLDFCVLAVGIATPRAKKPLRSELMLKERLEDVLHYENCRSIRDVRKESIVSKDQQRIMNDLAWIKNAENVKEEKSQGPYVRLETIPEDHPYPYFEVLAPGSRVGLAIPFILRFTVFGTDPWRKQWVQVVLLRGLGIAHNHITVMWDKSRGKLVLCPFYGDTHLNNILVKGELDKRLLLSHGDIVALGTTTKYKVVMPKKYREEGPGGGAYDHYDADFQTLSKEVQRREDKINNRMFEGFDTDSSDDFLNTRKTFPIVEEAALGATYGAHRSTDESDFDQSSEEDIDDFINSVISRMDTSDKSDKNASKPLSCLVDEDVQSEVVETPAESPTSPSPSGSSSHQSPHYPFPSSPPAQQPLSQPNSQDISIPALTKKKHGRSKFGKKTKLFVTMHGDSLNKTMLMDNDATHAEFIARIEQKLSQRNLAIYYEEEDGDRVEVDDDDAVTMFLSRKEGEKFKVVAFPAELGGHRMARAFAPSQIVDASRQSAIDTHSTPSYPVDPTVDFTRYSSYSGSYSSAISYGGNGYGYGGYGGSPRGAAAYSSFRSYRSFQTGRRESNGSRRFSTEY